MDGPHWHAFAWTGREIPSDRDARDLNHPARPNTNALWLLKPRRCLLATHPLPDTNGTAYAWLEGELKSHPRGPRDWPPHVDLDGARDCLNRHTDVIWGYWSATGLYISRALIRCPRPDIPCPLNTPRAAPASTKNTGAALAPSAQYLNSGGLPA